MNPVGQTRLPLFESISIDPNTNLEEFNLHLEICVINRDVQALHYAFDHRDALRFRTDKLMSAAFYFPIEKEMTFMIWDTALKRSDFNSCLNTLLASYHYPIFEDVHSLYLSEHRPRFNEELKGLFVEPALIAGILSGYYFTTPFSKDSSEMLIEYSGSDDNLSLVQGIVEDSSSDADINFNDGRALANALFSGGLKIADLLLRHDATVSPWVLQSCFQEDKLDVLLFLSQHPVVQGRRDLADIVTRLMSGDRLDDPDQCSPEIRARFSQLAPMIRSLTASDVVFSAKFSRLLNWTSSSKAEENQAFNAELSGLANDTSVITTLFHLHFAA